jgi:IS5 family transposase
MRKAYSNQLRFDCLPIEQVTLNFECRDEIVPVLAGLQYLFEQNDLRENVIELIAGDVNATTCNDIGREGFDYWQVLVLAVVRLGCDLNYDKLQDLCENHRALRSVLGIGSWDEATSFDWRRIRDTLCLLQPETIEKINQVIVTQGQLLHGDARQRVRADSFVVETNIHYPTESSLIWDGIRKLLPVGRRLATSLGLDGWRQTAHHLKKTKHQVREIARLSASKSPQVKARVYPAYGILLARAGVLLDLVRTLKKASLESVLSPTQAKWLEKIDHWYELTSKVVDTAFRRTQLREQVPNDDKIFSIFEPHTQLYRRGKAGEPNQFGRLAMIFEDGAGFISHYYLMDRQALDKDVVIAQTRTAQHKHRGEIQEASFDRGYFSDDNQTELESILDYPCLPPRHRNQYATWLSEQSVRIHEARKSHSGVESAIGAIQCGNGLKRCRDRTEEGLERYLGLAILGRNLHVLGKLLIAQANAKSEAARTKRKKAG